jgi:hypothetical protein
MPAGVDPRIFGALVGLFVGAGGGVLKFRDMGGGGRGKGGRGKEGEKRRREWKKGGKKRRVRSPRSEVKLDV